MQPEETYQHLENLAEKFGISVRYEDLYDPEVPMTSGLCKVAGRHFYIMDTSKSLPEKIRLLAQCLCRMDLDSVYLLPAIRDLLNAARSSLDPK